MNQPSMRLLRSLIAAAALLTMTISPALRAQIAVAPVLNSPASTAAPGHDVKIPEFDAVSVRPHRGDDRSRSTMQKPDGFAGNNMSLDMLVSFAYGTRLDLISGLPSWAKDLGFDVEAKVAGPDVETLKKLTQAQRRSMLQSVLASRFHLAAHTETKTMPIYELVVASGGVKMTASPEPPPDPDAKPGDQPKNGGRMMMMPGRIEGTDLPASSIANQLANVLQKTVVDKTGLTAKYKFTLKFQDDNGQGPGAHNADTDSAPSIFTAVQEQLGLRLVSTKGPVQVLIVDKVEKPSEN